MDKISKAKDFFIAAYWNILKGSSENKENKNMSINESSELSILRHRGFALLFQSEAF